MIDTSRLVYIAASVPLLYAVQLVINFWQSIKATNNYLGFRHLLSPTAFIANVFPTFIPGVAIGMNRAWVEKYDTFRDFGSDIYTIISVWPRSTSIMFNVADPAAIKEIVGARSRWVKPVEQYSVVNYFGGNIVASEGDEWKKHRKIANPAFSEPNNRLVWSEAVRITLDMIENEWKNAEVHETKHANDITLSIALLIIGSAGFGRKISFSDDLRIPPGHKMSFKDALHYVSTNMIIPVMLPAWALNLTEHLRTVRDSVKELRMYMQEMIDERRTSDKKSDSHDLFTKLLEANLEEVEGSHTRLDDSELIGNIFIFLLAGHETTAHTLCFTLGLLALHPEEQEILYQNIMNVLPDGRIPDYDDINALSYVTAVFHETLRLFPPVINIPKKSAEDTTLTTTNSARERVVIPAPKGSRVTLHTPGLHYNSRYWKDPYKFRPQRFMEDWPRDAFLPFSGGARSCIGRRFSETESTAILTILMQRYRVEVLEEPQFAGETYEQRRDRLFKVTAGITLVPVRVPLVFKRR